MSHLAHFYRGLLRNPAQVGAIAPTSWLLARRMSAGVKLNQGESILEFGPGTGPFTEHILRVVPNDAYLGIEIDPEFVGFLRRRFAGLRFVNGSAEDAHALHAKAGLGPVKVIISGLPFACLPASVQDSIMDGLDRLMPVGCIFRTFQYVHAYVLPAAIRFRRRMGQIFGPHECNSAVLWNLPPALVLTWTRV